MKQGCDRPSENDVLNASGLQAKRVISLGVGTLITLQAFLLIGLAWHIGPNRTEIGHLGATVYFWHTGKFDVFHVNPPLMRIVAGAPIALFCHPHYDWKPYSSRPEDRCEWPLGSAFVAANGFDDSRIYVFLARLACLPFVLIGGYFCFRFASELYGNAAGLVALILWTFSPLILGWGSTLCPDVAAASMGIIGLHTFWHWLKRPSWKNTMIAGLCLGLMVLVKMTWIIAFPLWCCLYWFRLIVRQPHEERPPVKRLAVMLLLGLYTINMGYAFDHTLQPLREYRFISGVLSGTLQTKDATIEPGNRFADSWIGHFPVPFPREFVLGIDTQKLDFERGIDSYARGEWSDHGWWWYYGYVLMLKEPLGVWGLTIIALGMTMLGRCGKASLRNEAVLLIPLVSVFVFISGQSGFSLHPRYAVLVLPFLYIFLGKTARLLNWRQPIPAVLTVACLCWITVGSLSIYPQSISYFNESAGKSDHWPHALLGSNIDWGQGSYGLREWTRNHPEATPLFASYTMPIPLETLGINAIGEVPSVPTPGWMVIGVNELYERDNKYEWLRNRPVNDTVGFGIRIYYIEDNITEP